MANSVRVTYGNFSAASTLKQLYEDLRIAASLSELDFLNYKEDEAQQSNADRIFDQYLDTDRVGFSEDKAAFIKEKSLIRGPVSLSIPTTQIAREVIAGLGNAVVKNTSYQAFLSESIKQILNNPGFKPIQTLQNADSNVTKTAPRHSVWLWSKSLGLDENGALFDLSPFVISLNISNGENGGNFQLILPALNAVFDETKGWSLDLRSIKSHSNNNEFVAKSIALTRKGDTYKKNKSFFHNIIGPNDIVFISFERLELEESRQQQAIPKEVTPDDLPRQYYDMIALVDVCAEAYNPEQNDTIVTVSGRDQMKLLIEDGTHFFPYAFPFNQQNEKGFFQFQDNEGLRRSVERLNTTGNLALFTAYIDRTIEFSIQFIINTLSNIEIAPDSLFSKYPDRNYQYLLQDGDQSVSKRLMAGIWQIIKVIIDPEIANRRIVDSSLASPNNSLVVYIRQLCQAPFVEFFSDTYGSNFYFIIRKPPFSKDSYLSNYENLETKITIEEQNIYQESLSFDDSEVYSWYQLIPRGNFLGQERLISLFNLPAVFFKEYADIWGSRPLRQISNYIDYKGTLDANRTLENLEFLREQAIEDLNFVIETNAYLPFTRKGTFVIKGDRRIKRGMTVYRPGTDEIYYVDAVSNSYSIAGKIDRATQIQVSRGMIKNHYLKYFNIIDFNKENSTWKVNREIFNFFIKRRQFV